MKSESLRNSIRTRAGDRCEYCQLRQAFCEVTHHVEHIVARQHIVAGDLDNLALACHYCNRKKGPNLAGIDPLTGEITVLFHPRRDHWHDHFRWNGPCIEGISRIGRTTVNVLSMNDEKRMRLRLQLQADGILY
ncbi:MAG: HNH endonuclease [Bryobacteraceae bacterium]